MPSGELLGVCVSAFVAVFTLLTLLALVMRLIMAVFPEKKVIKTDSFILAAIASVMSTIYPGTKVTKVEEIK